MCIRDESLCGGTFSHWPFHTCLRVSVHRHGGGDGGGWGGTQTPSEYRAHTTTETKHGGIMVQFHFSHLEGTVDYSLFQSVSP